MFSNKVLFPSAPNPCPTKINIGCGYDKKPGYVNLDSDPACSPDLLVQDHDIFFLPKGHFEEVYAKDVLEHIPRAFMMNALFDWASLLKIGGELFVQTSWIYGIIDRMRAEGTFEFIHNWKVCLFGNQVHQGDFHHNGFTEETLAVYLAAVGLQHDGFKMDDGWLISTRAKKSISFSHLLTEPDYTKFLVSSYNELLFRDPEPERMEHSPATQPCSKARYLELRSIAGAPERLYKIGTQRS
jgi:hypothetical protein